MFGRKCVVRMDGSMCQWLSDKHVIQGSGFTAPEGVVLDKPQPGR